jgi:hypothetical protein
LQVTDGPGSLVLAGAPSFVGDGDGLATLEAHVCEAEQVSGLRCAQATLAS